MKNLWQQKRVLLTGHTGFKGAWMALWLESKGAQITGIALPPEPEMRLFSLLSPNIDSHYCDIRNADALSQLVQHCQPEIVIHMAAEALVQRSYQQPLATFATNILGTANLLQALLQCSSLPQAILVVTSDKVYQNTENGQAFSEEDKLGGDDPYSASKACAELVTHSFRESYFRPRSVPVVTARAGNVIGGGDWSLNRLIPDVIRSLELGTPLALRHPDATRPWQHVFDVISGYTAYIEALIMGKTMSPSLNFGPEEAHISTAGQMVAMLKKTTLFSGREGAVETVLARAMPLQHTAHATADSFLLQEQCPFYPEKQRLALDSGLARSTLGWQPRLTLPEAVEWTAAWYHAYLQGTDMRRFSLEQLAQFEALSL